MKKTIQLILFFLFPIISYTQTVPKPCGTPSYKSDWLKKYQKDPSAFDTRTDDPIYLPLSIFLLADDSGLGAFTETATLEALCRLEKDFEGTDIVFYVKGPFTKINNSAYYDHGTVLKGAEMMFELNIPNTLNNYIVRDPAGNCGYNLPYAGVALGKGCAGASDHTWAHEIGHALSLPHPFIGWEGGISHDGSIPHDYNDPAPDTVLIDYTYFQDTLILDTLIIDTLIVEKIDGSNCHYAADGFCDTKPDYLGMRWPCNASTSLSNIEQTDPNGEKFNSDGSWFMSYAFDACSNAFSGEQVAAMRANILDEKASYLDPTVVEPNPVTQVSELQFPIDEALVPYSGVELSWTEAEHADSYLLQLGFEPTLSAILFDTIVKGNSVQLFNLNEDYEYYWRVRGFNNFHFCSEFSEKEIFNTGDFVNTNDLQLEDALILVPNPSINHQRVSIQNHSGLNIEEVIVYNLYGKKVLQTNGADPIDTEQLNAGLFWFKIRLESNQFVTKKMLVH